jgi:glycosyltransferase involved in cell wall biosynthesis
MNSASRKIILVGTLPPPVNGQSMAFKIIVDWLSNEKLPVKIVNIANRNILGEKRFSYLNRIIDYTLVAFQLVFFCLQGKSIVYIQTSQSKMGFLRDKLIVSISKFFGAKVIGHLHGGNYNQFYEEQSPVFKRTIKKFLLDFDKTIVLSSNLKPMFDFQPLMRHRIITVLNGVGEVNHLTKAKSIQDYSKENPLQLLYLSNLIESKGYLVFLDALNQLKQNGIFFEAKFCGLFRAENDQSSYESPEHAEADFLMRIEAYQLVDCVKYIGLVRGKEKEDLLKKAHFFVLPTAYTNEGQPLSIIEAMSFGCVVVSTNYRAIPEMITHGHDGLLIDKPQPDAIVECITACLNDKPLYTTLSGNAIQSFNEKFTGSVHCQKIASILKVNAYI